MIDVINLKKIRWGKYSVRKSKWLREKKEGKEIPLSLMH